MATVNFTGLETNSFLETPASGNGGSIVSSPVHSGDYAFRSNPTTTQDGFITLQGYASDGGITATYNIATGYHRFYFWWETKPTANSEPIFWSVTSGGSCKLEGRINSSAQLEIYDSAISLLATGTIALTQSAKYRIEVKVGTGASAAWEAILFLGESTSALETLSGTANLHTSNNGKCYFGKVVNRNGNTCDFYYDDMHVDDAAYPGPGSIVRMDLNGDGNYTAFTIGAGSGSDWQNVEELPPDDDTTYLLSSGVTDEASTFALESATSAGISGTILSTKSVAKMKRDSANGAVRMRHRSASTDSDSTSNTTTGSGYLEYGMIRDTDPATGSAWLVSALDNWEVGIRERSTNLTRLTSIYAMVSYTPQAVTAFGSSFFVG